MNRLEALAPTRMPWLSRREFLAATTSLLLPAIGACGTTEPEPEAFPRTRRLAARPGTPILPAPLGESALGLETGRDGLLFVPLNHDQGTPLPLYIFLHGATASAASGRALSYLADDLEAIVLIPESRDSTWDLIQGRLGPDVAFLDRALQHTFDRCAVDPTRVALVGHSDGATYALSIGVSNGDLFTHVVGHSPGGIDGRASVELPEVFVSHGTQDNVLPVQISRDQVVPDLTADGYVVEYLEYDGGHELPLSVVEAAVDWFLGRAPGD